MLDFNFKWLFFYIQTQFLRAMELVDKILVSSYIYIIMINQSWYSHSHIVFIFCQDNFLHACLPLCMYSSCLYLIQDSFLACFIWMCSIFHCRCKLTWNVYLTSLKKSIFKEGGGGVGVASKESQISIGRLYTHIIYCVWSSSHSTCICSCVQCLSLVFKFSETVNDFFCRRGWGDNF